MCKVASQGTPYRTHRLDYFQRISGNIEILNFSENPFFHKLATEVLKELQYLAVPNDIPPSGGGGMVVALRI